MKSVLAPLLFIALLIFLKSLVSSKTKDKEIVKEQENTIICPRKEIDIINDYYLLMLDIYLRDRYENLASWEFRYGNHKYYYNSPCASIVLTYRDGGIGYVVVRNKDIMDPTLSSAEKGNTNPSDITAKEENAISVVDYLFQVGDKISDAVNRAIEEGNGFYAYYEIEKELATDSFMTAVAKQLEENTGYDVSFNTNVLEIGFQNMM